MSLTPPHLYERQFASSGTLADYLLHDDISFTRQMLLNSGCPQEYFDDVDKELPPGRDELISKLAVLGFRCVTRNDDPRLKCIYDRYLTTIHSTSGSIVIPITARLEKDGFIVDKHVALKFVLIKNSESTNFGARFADAGLRGFLSEVAFAKELRSRNSSFPFETLRVYNYGTLDLKNGLTLGVSMMKRLKGVTVYEYLPTMMDLEDAEYFARLFVSSIEHLFHKNILHNDLHQANMLYDPTTRQLSIIDYGRSYIYDPAGTVTDPNIRTARAPTTLMKDFVNVLLLYRDYFHGIMNELPEKTLFLQKDYSESELEQFSTDFQLQYYVFNESKSLQGTRFRERCGTLRRYENLFIPYDNLERYIDRFAPENKKATYKNVAENLAATYLLFMKIQSVILAKSANDFAVDPSDSSWYDEHTIMNYKIYCNSVLYHIERTDEYITFLYESQKTIEAQNAAAAAAAAVSTSTTSATQSTSNDSLPNRKRARS
jgi:hypothetical protein